MGNYPLFSGISNGARLLLLIALIIFGAALSISIAYIIIIVFYGSTALSDSMTMLNIGPLRWMQILNQIGIFIAPPLAYVILTERKINETLKFTYPKGIHLIITLFLIFMMAPLIGQLMEWNEGLNLPVSMDSVERWMRESEDKANDLVQWMLSYNDPLSVMVNLLMIVLLPALGEELLFRSVMIKLFGRIFKNVHIAIWISAIIFSAFHFQFFGFLPRMFLGLAFGYIFVWSGSIWIPVLAHLLNNGTVVVITYLNSTNLMTESPSDFGKVDSPILLLISILLTLILSIIFYKTRSAQKVIEIED